MYPQWYILATFEKATLFKVYIHIVTTWLQAVNVTGIIRQRMMAMYEICSAVGVDVVADDAWVTCMVEVLVLMELLMALC